MTETPVPAAGCDRQFGVRRAVLRPIVGADKVGRLLAAGLDRVPAAATLRLAQVNGSPALILRRGGAIDTVVAVRIDDGLITGLYVMRNPEKLTHIQRENALRR
ncbi:sigma-70 family RNA polymerase sigma factor family protein [Saccharopolyspora pogona]|uniref:hypothetical protein n=1 Tax=Saccharopolyspora pogona TaxID=333966 RepID=UPI00295B50F7|nr:hypothetical protein [Saccharopolyspora pogona]